MKERPILFSAPMVRAVLAGWKTQTRRIVKPQPEVSEQGNLCGPWLSRPLGGLLLPKLQDITMHCPYGQSGDRLWVRETFFAFGRWETRFSVKKGRDEWHFIDMTLECGHAYSYAAADGGHPLPMRGIRDSGATPGWWKRPAIFMPRAASRILLDVTAVRVERLQDISEADAIAEGCATQGNVPQFPYKTPIENYATLWESINGPGSWKANPFVWVVAFQRVEKTL